VEECNPWTDIVWVPNPWVCKSNTIIHKELYTRHAIQCTSFAVVYHNRTHDREEEREGRDRGLYRVQGIDNVYMVPPYL